ncbi:site-specific integrase [Flavobacterium sp.]|uniref:tyrosine-type recombinase/integrase n=1 Tax=Flavobacterium sp. TaxID=239 RepID=UPI00286D91D3|nr:site-specific integrase [Flavobacterium sp.]
MTLENYLLKKYKKSSLNPYLCSIRKYFNFIQNRAETATYQDILEYVGHLRKNENLQPKTIKHYLLNVKIYYYYLIEIGKRNDHPCSELYLKDKINRQIAVDTLYTPETLENFLNDTHKDKILQRRNQVIISLLIYQGLTVGEICNLQIEDINLEKAEIYIKSSDKKKSRTLPLQAKQILLFLNYLKEDYPKLIQHIVSEKPIKTLITGKLKEEVRPNVLNRMINDHREKSQQLQPIKIRQSVIANLLKKENDTRIVQVFAGHKRASTTILYKQTELEILQNAINLYHPIREI